MVYGGVVRDRILDCCVWFSVVRDGILTSVMLGSIVWCVVVY